MRPLSRLAALAALVLVAACGGGGGGGGGSGPITAAWRYVSGPAFSGPQFSSRDFEGDPRFLVLAADGTVSLTLEDPDTGTLFCHHGVFTVTSSALVLDVRREFESVTLLFLRSQPDASTLVLVDSAGGSSQFAREASVPPELQCKSFQVRATYPGLGATPTFFTGMAYDGTSLWFTEENETEIFPIDPATGALGVPVATVASQFQMVHAAQAGDFWLHCRCGGSEDAERRTKADALVDHVDTATDLSNEISIRAIAFDPGPSVVWFHGFSQDSRKERFLKVNADAEPDVLLDFHDYDVSFRSMTWDGLHMWAVMETQNVVEIDMTTFQAVATYDTPDVNVEWIGIASAPASVGGGNSLYLIGRDTISGDGVLKEVQP